MKRCILDGEIIKTREQLHDMLQRELELPEWYGRNLDALYDCLTEGWTEILQIEIRNREALTEHLGRYAGALEQVIRDAARENGRVELHTFS